MEHSGEGSLSHEQLTPEVAQAVEEGKKWVDDVYNDPARGPHIELTISSPDDRPSKNKDQFDPRLLEQLFPPEEAGESFILGITAIHGNEPSIMTATIAAEINDILKEHGMPQAAIVLPTVYAKTRDILLEDFPAIAGDIYTSDGLGAILKKTEFSGSGYQAHLRSVDANHEAVQDELYEFLSEPFKAVSLTGEEREFQPRGKRLEINAGANVTASEPEKQETDFIFPVTLSDLTQATLTDRTVGRHFNTQVLERVHKYALEMEKGYRTTQLPYFHTLSAFQDFSPEGKLFIPHIKRPRQPSEILALDNEGKYTVSSDIEPRKGIYVMASGSEIGIDVTRDVAAQFHAAGYDVIAPKWLNLGFGKAAIPDVLYHPEMQVIQTRLGWGIIWNGLEAGVPILAMPHMWFDNPEMHFNLQTVNEFNFGREYDDRLEIVEDLIKLQAGIEPTLEEANRKMNVPEGMDGIRLGAVNILEAALSQKRQQMLDTDLEHGFA
jgi:hypothetical protein